MAKSKKQKKNLESSKVINDIYSGRHLNEAKEELEKNNEESLKRYEEKVLKENTCWDDLNNTHALLLVNIRTQSAVSVSISNKNILDRISDKHLLIKCFKALTKHIREISKDIRATREKHVGKTGHATCHQDIIDSMVIFSEYHNHQDIIENCITPTVIIIAELIDEAGKRMIEDGLHLELEEINAKTNAYIMDIMPKNVLSDEQNPKIVSDAVVKEVNGND